MDVKVYQLAKKYTDKKTQDLVVGQIGQLTDSALSDNPADIKARFESYREETAIYRPLVTEVYHNVSLQTFIDDHTSINIKQGNYLINASIKIPSNRRIFIEEGAIFTLAEGCNQYIFQNADLINGNENIAVYGGEFHGNGATQTRDYVGDTLNDVYYGLGFLFSKVTGLRLEHIKIYDTCAWAIGGNNCNHVYVDDLYFEQDATAYSSNKDGLTLCGGSHITVKNIKGRTSDDLVAMCAWGAQMGANELLFDQASMEDITIDGVTSITIDGKPAQTCLSLYQRSGLTMKNVYISNIKGNVNYCPIQIKGLDTATPHFFNINIDGVSCDNLTYTVGIVQLNANIDTININNLNRRAIDTKATICNFGTIDTLNISNVNQKWNDLVGSTVYDTGNLKNLNMNNVSSISLTGNTSNAYIYNKNNVASVVTTRVQGSNITLNDNAYNRPMVNKAGGNISVNSLSLVVTSASLTPIANDIIKDASGALMLYQDGAFRRLLVPDGEWISPTFTNNWVNFGGAYATAQYRKDSAGTVFIKGFIKSGTGIAFTLPIGFRPLERHSIVAISNNGTTNQLSTIDIFSNGDILPSGSNAWFSLGLISFKAEQ